MILLGLFREEKGNIPAETVYSSVGHTLAQLYMGKRIYALLKLEIDNRFHISLQLDVVQWFPHLDLVEYRDTRPLLANWLL